MLLGPQIALLQKVAVIMFRNDDFYSLYSTVGFLQLIVLTHSPTSFMDVDEESTANTAP